MEAPDSVNRQPLLMSPMSMFIMQYSERNIHVGND